MANCRSGMITVLGQCFCFFDQRFHYEWHVAVVQGQVVIEESPQKRSFGFADRPIVFVGKGRFRNTRQHKIDPRNAAVATVPQPA